MKTVEILDVLETHYGRQTATWPTEPYEFLVWWHCGYPASDAACERGWEALMRAVGVTPEKILAASDATLAGALKAGGMVPELRAQRLRQASPGVSWKPTRTLPRRFRMARTHGRWTAWHRCWPRWSNWMEQ